MADIGFNEISGDVKKLEESIKLMNKQLIQSKKLLKSLRSVKILDDGSGRSAQQFQENTKKLNTAIEKTNKLQKESISTKQRLEKEIQKGIQSRTRQGKAISNLRVQEQQFNKLQKREAELAFSRTKAGQKVTRMIREQQGALRKLRGTTGSFTKSILKATLRMGAMFLGFQSILRVVKSVIGIIVTFEKAQSKLASILGTTSKRIRGLTNDALKLGASTKFTASEVSGLQTELAKLGFDRREILASTKSILALAAATGSELAEAAILTGATLRSFELDASEAARVTDTLAKATSISALDMTKLATALPIVGATAKNAGVSLERTVAILGKITDRGTDASTAATALRNIFLELSKQGLTWNEAMEMIVNSTDKNKIAMELFGKRGATVSSIVSGLTTEITNMDIALQGAAGTADIMAKEQLDNLAGKTAILKSAWEGFVLSLDEGNSGLSRFLKMVVTGTTNLLNLATATEKQSDAIIAEQVELNILVGKLMKVNEDQEKRNILINELQITYPDFLKNLNAETTTNEDLAEALKLANKEYINKITIRSQEERILEAGTIASKIQQETFEEEARIREKLGKIIIKAGLDSDLLTKSIKEQVDEIRHSEKLTFGQSLAVQQLGVDNIQLQFTQLKLKKSEEEFNRIREQSQRIIDLLTKSIEEETKVIEEETKVIEDSKEKRTELEKESIKIHEALLKRLQEEKDAREALEKRSQEIIEQHHAADEKQADEDQEALLLRLKKGGGEEITEEQRIADTKREIRFALFDFGNALLDRQLLNLEEKNELGLISDEKFAKEAAKIKRRQAIFSKAIAVVEIGINIAKGIADAISKVITIPLAVLITTLGAIQLGVVLAQKIPSFVKGVVGYKGEGSRTSDSNLVNISNEESVITGDGTDKAPRFLEGLNANDSNPALIDALMKDGVLDPYSPAILALNAPPKENINDKLYKETIKNNQLISELLEFHKGKPDRVGIPENGKLREWLGDGTIITTMFKS